MNRVTLKEIRNSEIKHYKETKQNLYFISERKRILRWVLNSKIESYYRNLSKLEEWKLQLIKYDIEFIDQNISYLDWEFYEILEMYKLDLEYMTTM